MAKTLSFMPEVTKQLYLIIMLAELVRKAIITHHNSDEQSPYRRSIRWIFWG